MDLIKFVTLFMWLWRNSSKNSKGERGGGWKYDVGLFINYEGAKKKSARSTVANTVKWERERERDATQLQGHLEPLVIVVTCNCASWSLTSSASWTSSIEEFSASFFLPHKRMYNPAITVADPSTLLITALKKIVSKRIVWSTAISSLESN